MSGLAGRPGRPDWPSATLSEVVFLKMPSRQEKKRAKRHAKYHEVRDDVFELARASYKAEPEKKRTAEREQPRIQEFVMGGAVYQRGGNVCEAV